MQTERQPNAVIMARRQDAGMQAQDAVYTHFEHQMILFPTAGIPQRFKNLFQAHPSPLLNSIPFCLSIIPVFPPFVRVKAVEPRGFCRRKAAIKEGFCRFKSIRFL